MTKPTLLVTGASGNLGKRVVEILLAQNAGRVIAMTRRPDKIAEFAARNVEIRTADFADRTTMVRAFAGADRVLLISTDALFPPGTRLAQHRNAIAAAVGAGAKHVVYTSGPAPHPIEGGGLLDDHFWTEEALFASPIGWTIMRHQIYTDTLLGSVALAAKSGELVSSIGTAGSNYVTREDCARTDAAALAADFDGHRILDVTGPAPVTQAQIAALASTLTGKAIKAVTKTADQQRAALTAAKLPPFLIDALIGFDRQAAQGHQAIATSTVADLTGRRPTSVEEFLTANRAALAG